MSDLYFNHQELIKRTKLLATTEFPQQLRLFDRHVGLFYKKRVNGGLVDYSPIQINRKGMADVWGVYCFSFNGAMVPLHIELEFKTGTGKLKPDQKVWKSFCESMGWLYFLVRDENIFIEEFKNELVNRSALMRGF